jgi:hypothetical protein
VLRDCYWSISVSAMENSSCKVTMKKSRKFSPRGGVYLFSKYKVYDIIQRAILFFLSFIKCSQTKEVPKTKNFAYDEIFILCYGMINYEVYRM